MADTHALSDATESYCKVLFGHRDFDLAHHSSGHPHICPIRGCKSQLAMVRFGAGQKPYCPTHGLRLHSNTFVYWNGKVRLDQGWLRNFPIRPDLAILIRSMSKAESYRL